LFVKLCFGCAGTGVERRLTIVESIKTTRAEGLLLEQSRPEFGENPRQILPYDCENLGPGIRKVNIRF